MILLSTGDQLDAAARLLWTVWEAGTDAERGEVISTSTLRALALAGNYVAGAFRGGKLIGCTVGWFGGGAGRVTSLHSHITGVYQPERDRGTGFALKRHQRLWALDNGLDTVTWTFDPLVSRNAYFNLCKLGATVTAYLPDFYGRMDDGANTGDHTDRLLLEWSLHSDWAEQTMGRNGHSLRRHAAVTPGAELIPVPGDIKSLRETDPLRARHERFAVRDRFLTLLAAGYHVAGMTSTHEYVLLPPATIPTYHP